MGIETLVISAVSTKGFWRCGKFFPKEGVVVQAADFTEKQWERLKSEGMLRIKKATKEVAQKLEDRAAAIAEAITSLQAEDFQQNGKPKVDALNALLGDDLGKITGGERDLVWDVVQENGFEAPKAKT